MLSGRIKDNLGPQSSYGYPWFASACRAWR
jgi:hypothetical protein